MKTLYFLKCREFVKIGIADDVDARIAQLQTGNPEPLSLVAVIPDVHETVEGMFHDAFIDDHHSGEWFLLSPTLRKVVLLIRRGARPKTRVDINILKQFAPRRGFSIGLKDIDPEHGLGGFDSKPKKRIGLRSRSA